MIAFQHRVMIGLGLLGLVAPLVIYPIFLMKALCFALFACAFNLLIGYVGLLSFGHALYFGWASYFAAHLAKVGKVSIPYWAGSWQWLVIPFPPMAPEFAIVIADAWQGRRIGRRLLEKLIEIARARGVRQLYGDILGTNRPMIEFVHRLGFTLGRHEDPTLTRATLVL